MKFIGWGCGFGGDIEDTNSDKIYKCQKWTVQKSDISMMNAYFRWYSLIGEISEKVNWGWNSWNCDEEL